MPSPTATRQSNRRPTSFLLLLTQGIGLAVLGVAAAGLLVDQLHPGRGVLAAIGLVTVLPGLLAGFACLTHPQQTRVVVSGSDHNLLLRIERATSLSLIARSDRLPSPR